METIQDFLNRLDKLIFVKSEGKTLHTSEGFEISYTLELMGAGMPTMPIQFQFRVRKEGQYVMTWGCDSNESTLLAVKWWEKKDWDINTLEYDKMDKKKRALVNEFKQLTR